MKVLKPFYVSVSMITNYGVCPRLYYFKAVRRLDRDVLNVNFLTGNLVHHGMHLVFSNRQNTVESAVKKMYRAEMKIIRKRYPEISTDDEQKLVQSEIASIGMINGYRRRYGKFLQDVSLIENEKVIKVDIGNDIIVVGSVDNLVKNKKAVSLVEIKTTRSINRQYVQNIKIDFQTSTYWHMLKRMKVKLSDILYKVLRKPSIRQTKKESKGEFLVRLGEWYTAAEDESKFHVERMKEPGISEENVMNTITQVVRLCRDNEFDKDKYFQNFGSCIREWGKCDYYELCHEGGETKENLLLFKVRERFKVDKQKKGGEKT